jgi:DNA gyrase subunit B
MGVDNMENDKVRALTDRQQARDKLPVFYGSRDNFPHGLREVINNAVDEILNNFENGVVNIHLHQDLKTITVTDTGRGLPIADIDDDGTPYHELLLTTLFAGAKYDDNDKTQAGTNGSGLCCLNYTSTLFQVTSYNQGKEYYIEYKDGGIINVPLNCLGTTDKHGTMITFKLDESVYTNIDFTYELIKFIADRTSKVSPNVTLTLTHGENKDVFHYDDLCDYFIKHTDNNFIEPLVFPNKEYLDKDGEKTQVEVVFSCSGDEDLLQEAMLNGNPLTLQSTIHEGFFNGMRNFINKYLKDTKEKPIKSEDIANAVNFCCNVMSNRVEFEGQTKFSTEKKLYRSIVSQYVQEMLETYSIERKEDFLRLVNQVLICQKAYEKTKKSIAETKKKLSEKVDNLDGRIDGLTDCKFHNEDSEFYICEGKSAQGSVASACNPKIQASYGIRGKILNCLKANYEKIFDNTVIITLIRILGCGVEVKSKHNKELDSFNIKNLRYGKVVISTDQDFDGLNIQVLLLTMIYRLMPQLLIQGKVYIAQTPKYVIKTKKDKFYAFDETHKDEIVKSLGSEKHVLDYVKGLGELDAKDMAYTALNPDTRNMIKVTIESVENMIKQFDVWCDEDVSKRKSFIQEHLHEYDKDEN